MNHMVESANQLGWSDLKMVSVTLDPHFDTPGVWRDYARVRGIDNDRFFLLTGPPQIVEDLKKQMGVLSEPDEVGIIRHTMSTALIDPKGEIIYRLPGSRWNPDNFIQQIEKDRDN